MTIPGFPNSGSGAPKRRSVLSTGATKPTDRARNIIGVIHLILGGWVVAGGVFGVVFAGSFSLMSIAPAVVLVCIAATMAVGGVMIRDGQRRGALLLVFTDGLLLAAKLLGALVTGSFNFEFLLIAGMLGSVVWLWPSLPSVAKPSNV